VVQMGGLEAVLTGLGDIVSLHNYRCGRELLTAAVVFAAFCFALPNVTSVCICTVLILMTTMTIIIVIIVIVIKLCVAIIHMLSYRKLVLSSVGRCDIGQCYQMWVLTVLYKCVFLTDGRTARTR